jgi:hypothetical protein
MPRRTRTARRGRRSRVASRIRPTVAVTVLLLAVSATSCSAASSGTTEPEWGRESVTFLDALAAAYRANDVYGVLDFYTPTAVVEKWRGDNRGGSAVADLLKWNSSDLGLIVESVHLGDDQALSLVEWTSSDDRGAVVSSIVDGHIRGEVAYDLGSSLVESLRADPILVGGYVEFMAAFADAWSTGDPPSILGLYGPGATVTDVVDGMEGVPVTDVLRADADLVWTPVTAGEAFQGDPTTDDPAVFLGPSEYGHDPQRAVGIFDVLDGGGCHRRVAVRWTFDAGLVVDEERYQDVASYPTCSSVLPEGWWTGLTLPPPADEVVTGTLVTPAGKTVEIHNGTAALVDLLAWGLGRFSAAGLAEPAVDSVTFEPSRSCAGLSGRVIDDGEYRNLYVCMYERDICTALAPCNQPATRARVAFLHELGHAWMIDHVDERTEEAVLDVSGRSAWDDPAIPWVERGVEYSADVVAWGLLEEALPMVRIGSPPCTELTAAFRLLTGVAPPRGDRACG